MRSLCCLTLALSVAGLCRAEDLDRVRGLINDLGADEWEAREAATAELASVVDVDPDGPAQREVEAGLASHDPEVAERCRWILAEVSADDFEVVVEEVVGEADCRVAPRQEWQVVEPGMRLPQGTRLCTGVESRIVLSFSGYARVVVEQCTLLELRSIDGNRFRVAGELYVDPGVVSVHPEDGSVELDIKVTEPRLTRSVR